MKRIILLMTLTLTAIATHAQQGLNINELFEGRIVPQERMVETRVRGRTLNQYQLSFFHSVRMQPTADELARIMELIELDSQNNSTAEERKRKNELTLMIQLPARGDTHRFLCLKNRNNETTVIYMEGSLSDFDALNQILTNK